MSGHCHVCGTPGCNGSCNEMRGLSVREQSERINEDALGLIKAVMQKQTSAMLEALEHLIQVTKHLQPYQGTLEIAQKAIAAVKGE